MELPRVSVITPVFNGENYIQETIESVLNTVTHVPLEYIVINDGSTDRTLEIVSRYSSQIQILNFQNQGESASVNAGLAAARGAYVVVVSADDPILDGSLFDKAVQILDERPKITAVYPDWQVINEIGEVVRKVTVEDFSLVSLVGKNKTLPGPGAFFRRESAVAIGGRRSKWKYVGDYDFWLRLSALGDFQRIPECLAQWREHSSSTSVSQKNSQMANERITVVEEFLQNSDLPLAIQNMALSNAYYLAARLAYFDKAINGRKLMLQSIRKGRRFPSEGHPLIVLYLLLYPLSRYISLIIPRSLAKKTLKP